MWNKASWVGEKTYTGRLVGDITSLWKDDTLSLLSETKGVAFLYTAVRCKEPGKNEGARNKDASKIPGGKMGGFSMEYFFQQVINGLALGSIYGLIAIGYTMVYGIIGMINFAHGDVFMLGAFIALIVFSSSQPSLEHCRLR